DAALDYAARGWSVFPCEWRELQRKKPLTDNGYKDASTDPQVIRRWWGRCPSALIGTPTGHGFVVLDIDVKRGQDGRATLAALGFAELPPTPTARTGSGGWHLYFAEPVRPLHSTQGARGRGIGPGLDWRGTGGYVIAPSPGSGYEWVEETLALPLAPVP